MLPRALWRLHQLQPDRVKFGIIKACFHAESSPRLCSVNFPSVVRANLKGVRIPSHTAAGAASPNQVYLEPGSPIDWWKALPRPFPAPSPHCQQSSPSRACRCQPDSWVYLLPRIAFHFSSHPHSLFLSNCVFLRQSHYVWLETCIVFPCLCLPNTGVTGMSHHVHLLRQILSTG